MITMASKLNELNCCADASVPRADTDRVDCADEQPDSREDNGR